MARKKYWIKRSLLPEDKNDRAQVTKVVRWRVGNGKQMCASLGPDTVIEGDFDDQPDLEQYKRPGPKKPEIKSEKVETPAKGAETKSEKVSGKGRKEK